jgi:hypothetical protein
LGLLGLLISLLAASASAQVIWKWRDAEGRIQLSDRAPPADVPDKDILMRPGSARAVVLAPAASAASGSEELALSPSPADKELEVRKRRLLAEQNAAKEAALTAEAQKQRMAKAESCRRAQAQVKMLESGQRVARPNAQGEMEVLGDKARAEESQRVRALASSACT